MAGFTLTDFKRNAALRNNLKTYSLKEEIKNKNINWYDRILRMNENKFPNIGPAIKLQTGRTKRNRKTQDKVERWIQIKTGRARGPNS